MQMSNWDILHEMSNCVIFIFLWGVVGGGEGGGAGWSGWVSSIFICWISQESGKGQYISSSKLIIWLSVTDYNSIVYAHGLRVDQAFVL